MVEWLLSPMHLLVIWSQIGEKSEPGRLHDTPNLRLLTPYNSNLQLALMEAAPERTPAADSLTQYLTLVFTEGSLAHRVTSAGQQIIGVRAN